MLAAAAAAATTAAVALVIFAVFVSCCAFRFDDEAPAVSALYGCSATLNGMLHPQRVQRVGALLKLRL